MNRTRPTAYVRICAWKSRLLSRAEAASLMAAAEPAAIRRAVVALGLDAPLPRLLRVYRMTLRAVPDAAALLRALLRLHEIENVKLLWRTVVRGHDLRAARRLWIPLEDLATVAPSAMEAPNPRALTETLARTPYGVIFADAVRSFSGDGAAEPAFDRWGSLQLLDAARALPKHESLARRLAESVVRERDAEALRRGERWFGVSHPAALTAGAAPRGGRTADAVEIREERLRLCRRAFIGQPFTLAPSVALVLLAEAEMRAVRALVERQGEEVLDAAATRAMAGAGFES